MSEVTARLTYPLGYGKIKKNAVKRQNGETYEEEANDCAYVRL